VYGPKTPRNVFNRTHGMSNTPEHTAYRNARNRCDSDPKGWHFQFYAARGIKFLFTGFDEWYAALGLRPSKEHSVDRIDVNGNYEPGNVRWATKDVQGVNRRGIWNITYEPELDHFGDEIFDENFHQKFRVTATMYS
jgi:hypothetical protein